MKIDPNILIGAVTGKTAAGKQSVQGGSAFEDVLNNLQDKKTKDAQSVFAPYAAGSFSPQTMRAVTLSGQAVDMLDAYAKDLADPKVSLKDISSRVEELSEMRSAVLDAKSFLSDSDPLSGIMDEVASTLNGEVMRFRRGDLIG